MKNLYALFFALFVFSIGYAKDEKGGPASALSAMRLQGGSLDEVINSLRNGNAAELAKYVDANLEISLPSKTDNYTRQQATVILQDFFSNNGVKSFDVKHRGDNGGSQFCIGTLVTKSGSFRTTFFMTEKGGKQFVKEIRFQTM